MNIESEINKPVLPGRIMSVDFFRGFTMFLLAGEASSLYDHLNESGWRFIRFFGTQLSHHEGIKIFYHHRDELHLYLYLFSCGRRKINQQNCQSVQ